MAEIEELIKTGKLQLDEIQKALDEIALQGAEVDDDDDNDQVQKV